MLQLHVQNCKAYVFSFTSPLIRSKRTAELIWGGRPEEIMPESDLREIDLYSFQVSLHFMLFGLDIVCYDLY